MDHYSLCRNILRVVSNEKTVGNSRFQKLNLLLTLLFYLYRYTYIFNLIYGVRYQMKKKIIQKVSDCSHFSCQFKILCIINFIKKYLMNFKGHFYIHFTPKVLSFIIFSPSESYYPIIKRIEKELLHIR